MMMTEETDVDVQSDDGRFSMIERVAEVVRPTGWKVLVAIAPYEEKTSGGVYLPDETRDREGTANVRALVLAMGPLCFNMERFDGQRLYEVGDWVMIPPYAGTRLGIKSFGSDQEFRLINDDVPLAVIYQPEEVRRR